MYTQLQFMRVVSPVVQHRPIMVGHYQTNAGQTPYISCQIYIFFSPPSQKHRHPTSAVPMLGQRHRR